MKRIMYCCDTRTGEVYRAIEAKLIADVASHFKVSQADAIELISRAEINNTLKLPNDAECWTEYKNE